MLEVGMPGLSETEWQVHFSLWAMAAAPLWIGIDMTKMPAAALAIFKNADVIAVDQDPLGIMATCRDADGCPPPRSAHGPSHQAHPQLKLVPCTIAPKWKYEANNSITGGGALMDPHGNVLTEQGCAGTGAGDPLIAGYPPVPRSCRQKPGSPTNQAVKLSPGGKPGSLKIQMQQDEFCVLPNTQGAIATAKCEAVAGWAWTPQKQLQFLSQPSQCLGDGSIGPAPPEPKPVGEGQVWAR